MRYVEVKDLPHAFLIKNRLMNVGFLGNRAGKIIAGTYLVSITEIISSCEQVGSAAWLIFNNYALGFYLN